MIIYSMETM